MVISNTIDAYHIAIIGLGLMGGSLAMALRNHCSSISGYDPDPAVVSLAQERQIVDHASLDLPSVLHQADLVILAAPVRSILSCLHELPDILLEPSIVLDIGSTKESIVHAMASLPKRFDPIGGHPMCGKETSSLANAEANLFQDKLFILVPLQRTSLRARAISNQLVEAIGAYPLYMDAGTHDKWTAVTSHLPYLIASSLVLSTPLETAPLIGPGFRSTTRIAASSPRMMIDILATNRSNVLEAIQTFRLQLDILESQLADGDFQVLYKTLAGGAAEYARLLRDTQA